ncbi:uncharacterized protein LOC123305373 [Chrysoperla carnea]|uniref:uncharacterized protein LOC123305373 n=1 Tax=Chrysoperla carnea TaxID=189513 RepID=UPI001D07CB14|nr:uncharacterized protein LOC123305373 [Chrysoperla carnea]
MNFIKKALLNLTCIMLLTNGISSETSTKSNQPSSPTKTEASTETSTTEEIEEDELDYDDHDAIGKKSKPLLEKDEFANPQLQKLTPNSLKYFLTITIPIALVLVILLSTFWYIIHGPNCCFGKFNEVNYRVQVTESEAINRRLEELLTPI